MMPKTLTECDEIFDHVINGSSGYNYVLFDLAQCFISGYNKDKLRLMLRSKDMGVVLDGLFITGEIGDLAVEYLHDLAALALSDDPEVRRRAAELLAVYEPRSPDSR